MHLFAPSTLSALKGNVAPNRPKSADWQLLLARVDGWCDSHVSLPNQSGGWIHNYICPTHWLPLNYDGDNPQHHCPADHTLEGEKYDEAWMAWRHRQIADMSREIALAYTVTGDVNYLAEVVRVLLHYAAFYANFEGADSAESWMITARVFNQALTEALWAIPLIHAFDLVADALPAATRQQIERDFLRPLGETMAQAQDSLIADDHVKSNYMAWFNAALGCLGFALSDEALVERAIDGDGGFVKHLSAGVLADGMQYEVTPYYHNFVVLAYVILAEAAAANGRDLYAVRGDEGQSIHSMWGALTQCQLPDGTIADVADGSYWIDSVYDRELIEVYEIACARDPNISSLKAMLTHAYTRAQKQREGWAALLYGLESISSQPSASMAKPHLPNAGVTILHAAPNLAAVALYGAYRGSHSHGDQLSVQVWPFSNDAGCVLYGVEARRAWYQASYSHNTLVVDGSFPKTFEQAAATLTETNGEQCLAMQSVDAFAVAVERTVKAGNGVLEDVMTVSDGTAHTYDWVFHIDGQLDLANDTAQSVNKNLGDAEGAQFIEVTGQVDGVDSAEFTITHAEKQYTLLLTGKEPFDLLLGNAPGSSWNPTERRQVIIGRTVGKTQVYRSIISTK